MPLPVSLIAPIRSFAHYLDQPQVINGVHQFIQKTGIHGAFAGKFMYDLAMTPPEKRKDVLIEDALVLGPTWAATYLSLDELSEHADPVKAINQLKVFPELKKKYPSLVKLFNRVEKKMPTKRGYLGLGEINQIVGTVYNNKTKIRQGVRVLSQAEMHLERIFPLPDAHEHGSVISGMLKKLIGLKETVDKHAHPPHPPHPSKTFIGKFFTNIFGKNIWGDKMVKFFTLGGVIVVAGLVGGLVSDYLRGIYHKEAKVDKIKEGIFQFIANIAMCAVGATIGMTVADSVLPETLLKTSRNPQLIRMGRFGTIMAGLSIGIVGGGFIANWVGRKFVNPFFEWLDKRHTGYTLGEALKNAKKDNDRKVEFMDAILHLDDLPTALALAGVQIFVPFIPLFFAVSGYRTGIGYRNQSDKQAPGKSYSPENAYRQAIKHTLTPEQMMQLQRLMQARQARAGVY